MLGAYGNPGWARTTEDPPYPTRHEANAEMRQPRSDPGREAESGDAVSAASVWEQTSAEDGHVKSTSMGPYW